MSTPLRQISRTVLPVAFMLAVLPGAAAAHGVPGGDGSMGVPGMSEKQLRAFETATLGPQHAAEHARARRAARSHRGAAAAAAPKPRSKPYRAPHPQRTGRWGKPFRLKGVIGISAVMLRTGKVLYWSYPRNPSAPQNRNQANRYGNEADAVIWNPRNNRFKPVKPPLWDNPYDGTSKKVPANIWCAGQALLADGRVVVTGGNLTYPQFKDQSKGFYYRGLNQVYTFNPYNERWTRQPNMPHGRWYPTNLLMPDGRMVIMGGYSDEAVPKSVYNTNKSVEIFTPSRNMNGVGRLTTLKPDRNGGATVDNGVPPDGGLYPHLFWMLSGRVLVAGPDRRDSWWMPNPGTSGKLTATDAAGASRDRVWGSAVLLPRGPNGSHEVEQLGGSLYATKPDGARPPTNTTEVYNELTNRWTPGAPMKVARSHLNTVLLPDSSMVTVGGGLGNVAGPAGQWGASKTPGERKTELFDPRRNKWTLGARQTEARTYHSTAFLLPDATVVSTGDDYNGPPTKKHPQGFGTGETSDTAEIYRPPYLYTSKGRRAKRPKISRAPRNPLTWNQGFRIGTRTGRRAVLIAPSAVTHANDMNQRMVPLRVRRAGKGLNAMAPASANIALPGWYMLFVLDRHGVPSVARWVRLGLPTLQGPKVGFVRGGLNGRRGVIAGAATDLSGVKRVRVGLRAKRDRRCRWFSPKRRRFVRRRCGRTLYIPAKVRPTKNFGVFAWRVRLHKRVRRGAYTVSVRATNGRGRITTLSGAEAFGARVRR